MLETQTFEKKGHPSSEKNYLTNFSRIIEHDRSRGTFLRVQEFFGTCCRTSKSFFQDLRGCWKHKFLKMKAKLPVKKRNWRSFPVLSKSQMSENIFYGSTSSCEHYWGTYKSIFLRPKRLLKTQVFEEKGKLSSEKR